MKRIKYFIFTLLAASTIFVSCDLDRNPLDKFAENDFWTSEDNAELALTGVYKGNILFNSPEYTPTDWWSYGGLIFMEFPTDTVVGQTRISIRCRMELCYQTMLIRKLIGKIRMRR